MRMDDKAIEAIPCVSTGSLGIDIALGIGGFLGRIIEIYGPEALVRQHYTPRPERQKAGGVCIHRCRACA